MFPILLCIRDRRKLLQFPESALERRGFSVFIATCGLTAMAVLDTVDVDAVLLDYMSEGIDAEAVASCIKRYFPRTPVLLLSAHSDTPGKILCLVDDYILRSEPVESVVETIERLTLAAGARKNSTAA